MFMKNSALLLLIFIFSFSLSVSAQRTTTRPTPAKSPQANKVAKENESFEKAAGNANLEARIAALQAFIKDFPTSDKKNRAAELIVSARAQIGDEKLKNGEKEKGIEFFKAAVADAPVPVSDELFANVILQIPTNLFVRGEMAAAIEIAKMIEEKIGTNAKQIVALASFYLGTENASEGKRLAQKALEIDGNLPSAFQTLGLANRMNFMLDDAVTAYSIALNLDKNSIVSKRSLADVKRAVGKSDEAIVLYREILAVDAEDIAAQTGLILALFDAGKKAEAEAELAKSLEKNPNNLFLLTGISYWYAANRNAEKTIEYAQKALIVEPRYTWAHIALARGYLLQKQPLEAEKVLLFAKQFGDFPTLDYELATARLEAGFFREAAETLRRSFRIKDGYVRARLGGRVSLEAETFFELLGAERRAGIYSPVSADTPENSDRMKNLLDFAQKIEAAETTEAQIAEAAEKFIKGEDQMKFYRQMFIARKLLQTQKALPKILEIVQAAVPKVDAALNIPNPSAAVLADALYESRKYSFSRNQIVLVPEVARQTLSNILRGEIEEIIGWTLFLQGKTAESVARFKRAVSILPEKSAWWRSSLWRLGTALEKEGKSAEALEAYIKSYTNDVPSLEKYSIIETLYQKINGNTNGLEQKIGAKPASPNQTEANAQASPTPAPVTENKPTEIVAEVSPSPTPKTEEKTEPKLTPTPKIEVVVTENVGTGEVRQRRVPIGNTENAPCPIFVSQENISLLNGGGTLGILVGFTNQGGDLKQIKAVSSSPNDVQITLDPEIGANSERAFYIVKSVSTRTGIFTVSFEAPCGKKEITVKVR